MEVDSLDPRLVQCPRDRSTFFSTSHGASSPGILFLSAPKHYEINTDRPTSLFASYFLIIRIRHLAVRRWERCVS